MRKKMAYLMVVVLVAMVFSAVPTSVGAGYVGNVTILADGTVDPVDAPIHVKGMKYTLTDDILGSITIQKSGITLCGEGYTVEGSGAGPGIHAIGLTDLTIKEINVMNFLNGILLEGCDSSTIKESEVSRCVLGGINLTGSNGNTIKENKVHDNVWEGICLEKSSNNIIKDNEAWNQNEAGIFLWYWCDNNLIKDNNLHDNGDPTWGAGIFLSRYCDNNIIKDNDVSDKNSVGIVLNIESNNNLVTENKIFHNLAGGIYVRFDSNNNMITKNTIFKCYRYGQSGIRLLFSSGNTVSQNSVSKTYCGLLVVRNALDNGNIVFENTFRNNFRGLHFVGGGNNIIHHNNIIHNDKQVEDNSAGNQYDDGSAGNYWSDYDGKDADKDGIGDTPYIIYGAAGEQDDYPLMKPWNW
jgi:parallel beta-helix repeat protein